MAAAADTPHSNPSTKLDAARKGVSKAVDEVKPKLRGWLHACTTPLALAAGIVLIAVAPTALGKIGGAVFLFASVLLFGTSGIYHRFYWSDRANAVLRRMDHANIFIFIAATYTPLALLLLEGTGRVVLLCLVWGAALVGLLFRLFWLSAPRALYTVLYLAVGWAALGWLNQFWASGGPAVFFLIVAGGLLYSVGAAVYGTKKPNPSPTWFGFHEIFHLCTVLAFACHYTAISIATYAA